MVENIATQKPAVKPTADEEEKVLPRMLILVDRQVEMSKARRTWIWMYGRTIEWLEINSWFFLVGGLILNTFFLFDNPNWLNITFEMLYGVAFSYKINTAISRSKKTGTVKDASSGQPIDLAIIRVAKGERFVQMKVTDKSGLFFVILQPGLYTVYASKPGYQTQNKKVFIPQSKQVGIVNLDFKLTPAQSPAAAPSLGAQMLNN